MSRLNLRDGEADGFLLRRKIKGLVNKQLLTAQKVLDVDDPMLQVLDPNAATQDVLLPPEADSEGLIFIILNDGAGVEDLVVKEDSDTTTIATVTFPECAIFVCDGVKWFPVLGKGIT